MADDGGDVRYEPADVTNEDEVARVVEAATAWTGRLNGVVNCAGGSDTIGPITQLDAEAWRRRSTSMSPAPCSCRALGARDGARRRRIFRRHLVDRGEQYAQVVRGVRGFQGGHRPPDAAGRRRARPVLGTGQLHTAGLIRTDLVAAVLASPEVSADYAACTPLPRVGEVEDVANTAVFLLSDASSYVTGQVINVDGGMLVRRGPDYSAMFEPLFGADALRGVVPD